MLPESKGEARRVTFLVQYVLYKLLGILALSLSHRGKHLSTGEWYVFSLNRNSCSHLGGMWLAAVELSYALQGSSATKAGQKES